MDSVKIYAIFGFLLVCQAAQVRKCRESKEWIEIYKKLRIN